MPVRTTAHQPIPQVVATIATDQSQSEVARYYPTLPLYPDTVVASVDAHRPKFILIERAALNAGPWFGTEHEAGGALIELINRLEKWSLKAQCAMIMIDGPGEERYYTKRLRAAARHCFPNENFWSELPERPRRRKIYHLAQQFAEKAFEEGGSTNGS